MRRLRISLAILAGVAILSLATLQFLLHTDMGRERSRRLMLGALGGVVHGRFTIDRIEGDLLNRFTLVGLTITDSAGATFVAADSLSGQLAVRLLWSDRIELRDAALYRPRLRLVQDTDGQWNYERIFPRSNGPADSALGLGDWITLHHVRIVDGAMHVERPWAPLDARSPGARDSTIAAALAGELRPRVKRNASTFVQQMDFRGIHAGASEFVIADPEDRDIRLHIDSLRLSALPFNPPAIAMRAFRGNVRVANDSVVAGPFVLGLAGSDATGRLVYRIKSGDVEAQLTVPRLALADVRALYPAIPASGGGRLDVDLAMRETGDSEYRVRNATITSGVTTLTGSLGLLLGDTTLTFVGADVHATRLTSQLVEQLVPGLELPVRGEVTARALAEGPLTGMQVDIDGTVAAAGHQPFHARARGGLGFGTGASEAITTRRLQFRGDRVPLSLARLFEVDSPLGGTVTANGTVDGSTAGRLTGDVRLLHEEGTARSHVTVAGHVAINDSMRFDATAQLHDVALSLAQRWLDSTTVQGVMSGRVRAEGTATALRSRFALVLPKGGKVDGDAAYRTGRDARAFYRANVGIRALTPQAIIPSLPDMRVDGSVVLDASGTTLATLDGRIDARISPFVIDSAELRDVVVTAHARDGLVTLDSLSAATAFGSARATGAFGLIAARRDTVRFAATVDDLGGLRRWIASGDTTSVPARPALNERLARIRARVDSLADSVRAARDPATLLAEDLAGAREVHRRGDVAPLPSVRRDSIAGTIALTGTLAGSLEGATLAAFAETPGIVWGGNVFGRGSARATWRGALTDTDTVLVEAGIDSLRLAGFAFDSTKVTASYRRGEGEVELLLFPGDTSRYRLQAEYAMRTGEGELRLREIEFKLDTTTWRSMHPTVVSWRERGVRIDSLDLRDGRSGRIFANGEVPDVDPGHLEVIAEQVRLAPWLAILQSDVRADAVLSTRALWEGTREAPRLAGSADFTAASHNGISLPDTRTRFAYDARRLDIDVRARRDDGVELASVVGSLPIDLSRADSVVERLPKEGKIDLRVVGDSMPLSPLGEVSDVVREVRGGAQGDVRVGGTWSNPTFAGDLRVRLQQAYIVSNGVTLRDVDGQLRLSGDTVHVDSLIARSEGIISARGNVQFADITHPRLALALTMRDAKVLDDATGELYAGGSVRVDGPLDTLAVTGQVAVTRGVVYIPEPATYDVINTADPAIFAVTDTGTARALGVEPTSEMMRNLEMTVAVEVKRGTFARSAEANVEVYGTLQVNKVFGIDEYGVTGVLNTDQGDYTFLGKRFSVSRGSARFVGREELNPLLQIIANYQVQQAGRAPLDIRVVLGGTLERPTISLESDAQPTLSQSDLISFLAFGRSSSSLLQFSGTGLQGGGSGGSSLAGNVAALATRQLAAIGLGALANQARGELADATRADVLNITPAQLPADLSLGAVQTLLSGTEIEIGKYLDRRTFLIGRIRPTLAVPGATLERRLTERLRLRTTLETRFLPTPASLSAGLTPRTLQVIGALLTWTIAWD